MLTTQERDYVKAYPTNSAQQHCRKAVENLQWLSYQERIGLNKIAQGLKGRKDMEGKRRKDMEEERMSVIAILNFGIMTGNGREVANVMERKKIDFVQETRWKGQKAREIGEGYKLCYMGLDNRRSDVGMELSP